LRRIPPSVCSFISRESSPLLWASTYQAGEHVGSSAKAQEVSVAHTTAALHNKLIVYQAQNALHMVMHGVL
jgi:hypothetical protein